MDDSCSGATFVLNKDVLSAQKTDKSLRIRKTKSETHLCGCANFRNFELSWNMGAEVLEQ